MINTTNYSIPFDQGDLMNYVYKNKDVMKKLGNQLKSISNISEICKEGMCRGLAHTFAAYEINGLGAESINQLNNCLQPVSLTKSPYKQIEKYAQKSFNECISKILISRCTDIFNLQINQMPYIFYEDMANNVNSLKLPAKSQGIENLEYIMLCLDNNKNEKERRDSYNIEHETERKIIYDFYQKIELGFENPIPETLKADPIIYKKIQDKINLTESEIKLFLKDAYYYCGLHYSCETAMFNANVGIAYYKNSLPLSYNNIALKKIFNITLQKLEDYLSYMECNKKSSALIFSRNCHAMTISGRYDVQKKHYIFSFFEPNKGLLQTDDKTQLIKLIEIISKDHSTFPFTFTANFPFIQKELISQAIGNVLLLEKRNEHSKKLYLPSINKKEIQFLTKKYLAENKIDISIYNGVKLKFVDYYPENDELTLKLIMGGKTYTLYSELNDINKTIDLINASMDEYQKYKNQDIYIDWKGQILNRLKTA